MFNFHSTGPKTSAQVQAEADRVNAPLMGMAPGSFIRSSDALGTAWMERRTTTYPTIQRLERFYDIMVDDNAADLQVNQGGREGLPTFLTVGGVYANHQHYGWENFGDLGWSDGYCDLHTTGPQGILLGYWRTGDYRLYDKGRDMAAFRRDYAQNHSTTTDEWWRGAQFYEKGWWHGDDFTGQQSHTWLQGLLLHYAMTGDEGSGRRRSSASTSSCGIRRVRGPAGGASHPGLVDRGARRRIQLSGQSGLARGRRAGRRPVPAARDRGRCSRLPSRSGEYSAHRQALDGNIFFIAAAKYVKASGDLQYLPFLQRMRNFFVNTCIIPQSGSAPHGT